MVLFLKRNYTMYKYLYLVAYKKKTKHVLKASAFHRNQNAYLCHSDLLTMCLTVFYLQYPHGKKSYKESGLHNENQQGEHFVWKHSYELRSYSLYNIFVGNKPVRLM